MRQRAVAYLPGYCVFLYADEAVSFLYNQVMDRKEYEIASAEYPPFFKRVWDECLKIPAGETRSYGQIATAAGSPRGARAAAMALKHNPFAPYVPCHRVICSDGSAGGYSGPGGIETKLKLLNSEGVFFRKRNGRFFKINS